LRNFDEFKILGNSNDSIKLLPFLYYCLDEVIKKIIVIIFGQFL